jgi:RinA family phage transcriptional activator
MRKDIRGFIKTELRFYSETKMEYESFKEDLISTKNLEMSNVGGGKTNGISNPTQKNAMKLISSKRLRGMERIIRAIEKTLDGLNEEEKEFIKLRYWSNKRYTMDGILMRIKNKYPRLDIETTRTLYNWEHDICEKIACELGYFQKK